MTVKEIAELCGVDKTTVYRWVEHDNFLSCKMQLRKSILEQIQNGSPEVPADFSLEETLAIIRDGGKNETLAALLEKEQNLTTALQSTVETSLLPLSFKGCAVRTVLIGDVRWWIAKDVCDILGLDNVTEALRSLKDDEKITLSTTEGNPRNGIPHQLNAVNEPGLYRLIFQSRKPEAEAFKTWVFKEVLPSINRTGMYDRTGKLENLMERMEKVLIRIEKAQSTPSSYVCEQGREMVYEKMGPLGELFKQLNEQEDKRRQR